MVASFEPTLALTICTGVAIGVAVLLEDDDDGGALDGVPLFDGVFEHPAINAVAKSPVTRKDSGRRIYRISSSGVQCKRCARTATSVSQTPPAGEREGRCSDQLAHPITERGEGDLFSIWLTPHERLSELERLVASDLWWHRRLVRIDDGLDDNRSRCREGFLRNAAHISR